MKYAFAGDRDIAVKVLAYLVEKGYRPQALLLSSDKRASHARELMSIASLPEERIFRGADFADSESFFKDLELDYIIGVHFPYIIPPAFLKIPKIGFLNLHPAYLPYNKGWHTPTWAIVDGTRYGATLHFMSEKLDGGDIIMRKECPVSPADTANSLYQKVLEVEYELFLEALPKLLSLQPPRTRQEGQGTSYTKNDLKRIQRIDLDEKVLARDLIDKLRALTTNRPVEAAWFQCGDRSFRIRVEIDEFQSDGVD